jgi:hypothetical protein
LWCSDPPSQLPPLLLPESETPESDASDMPRCLRCRMWIGGRACATSSNDRLDELALALTVKPTWVLCNFGRSSQLWGRQSNITSAQRDGERDHEPNTFPHCVGISYRQMRGLPCLRRTFTFPILQLIALIPICMQTAFYQSLGGRIDVTNVLVRNETQEDKADLGSLVRR